MLCKAVDILAFLLKSPLRYIISSLRCVLHKTFHELCVALFACAFNNRWGNCYSRHIFVCKLLKCDDADEQRRQWISFGLCVCLFALDSDRLGRIINKRALSTTRKLQMKIQSNHINSITSTEFSSTTSMHSVTIDSFEMQSLHQQLYHAVITLRMTKNAIFGRNT